MATNFPNQLDNLQNPLSTDLLSSPDHAKQHQDVNDAVEALQDKLGVNGSTKQYSIDYRIVQLENKPDSILGAVEWTENHYLLPGGENTRYLAGDIVYDGGNVYVANFDNESLPTNFTQYWTLLGPGNRLNIDGRDIPNITYDQLKNKPQLPPLVSSNGSVGIGEAALQNNEGNSNVAVGVAALANNTTAYQNTAVGRFALSENFTGQFNVAVGYAALSSSNSSGNVAIGQDSLGSLSNGDNNIAIGFNSGRNGFSNLSSGSNNILIGSNSSPSSSSISNEITLGNLAHTRLRIPGLGIDWTTSNGPSNYVTKIPQLVSSSITAENGYRYFVDTSSATTITLPESPSLGDEIQVFDASGLAGTNNITLSRNGNNINGLTEDAIIDVDKAAAVLIYTGPTLGWRLG
jgi:hypothetical protein